MKRILVIIACVILMLGCKKKIEVLEIHPINVPPDESTSTVVVDCAESRGKIVNFGQANGTSTTSPLPGEASRQFLQQLKTKVTRVWIQLVFVYNNGTPNYNYSYSGGVPVEDALTFYSTTSDSLLICLSGHRNSGTFLMPTDSTVYKNFVRQTILYYKRKYQKIKYIQVSNEPDFGGETMATYYPVYKYYYRGLNEANAILQTETGPSYSRILLSNGGFTSNVPGMLAYAHNFFLSYKSDTDPNKKLDFFAFHSYGESNRPVELLTARQRIDSAMLSHQLPVIPIFLSEYGMVGGTSLPSGLTLEQTVTMQPAGQLTKSFYLYEGGISRVLNWLIHHGTIEHKSQILDVQNGYASPYGNALLLCRKLSDLDNRVKAESKGIDNVGLGIHTLAANGNDKGIGVLIWNYNWTKTVTDKDHEILIKNIPKQYYPGNKINAKIYIIDSKNNNYFINPTQTTLAVTTSAIYDYKSFLKIPVKLERSSVVLIMLTP